MALPTGFFRTGSSQNWDPRKPEPGHFQKGKAAINSMLGMMIPYDSYEILWTFDRGRQASRRWWFLRHAAAFTLSSSCQAQRLQHEEELRSQKRGLTEMWLERGLGTSHSLYEIRTDRRGPHYEWRCDVSVCLYHVLPRVMLHLQSLECMPSWIPVHAKKQGGWINESHSKSH